MVQVVGLELSDQNNQFAHSDFDSNVGATELIKFGLVSEYSLGNLARLMVVVNFELDLPYHKWLYYREKIPNVGLAIIVSKLGLWMSHNMNDNCGILVRIWPAGVVPSAANLITTMRLFLMYIWDSRFHIKSDSYPI